MPAGHGHSHGHSHSHGNSHSHDGHRECSTPPPPPGTVDLEQLAQRAEAERQRREEIQRASGDQGDGLPPVVEITPANLEAEVILRSEQVPVVVLIGAAGAADSLRLRSEMEQMARQAGLHWILAWVDAEANPQLARAFGVQALPTVTAVAMGSPIGMFIGEKTREWLDQWIAQVLEATRGRLKGLPAGTRMAGEGADQPEPTDFFGNPVPTDDPRLEQAEALLSEGNFDEALMLYEAMLQSEPANQGLKRARANVAFFARAAKIDRSSDPIAKADAAPTDVALALDAADVTMLVDDPAKALDRLLVLLPQVFGDDREKIKTRLLELLALFDTADPVALDARRRMASALY